MIIDLILDRKDGVPYNVEDFYRDVVEYGEVGFEISRALDSGTEKDVKKALCNYVIEQGYNEKICKYINSVNWLGAYEESKKTKSKKSMKESRAIYHESNIEYIVNTLLQNKCRDCDITYDFDGEDCYIDISQTNRTTGNTSVWSYDINFGSGKVYMLEPRSKYLDDFGENETGDILSIIKNTL